jgi:hypothetical protein
MEDVLEVYARPYDQKMPVVCLDEKPYQLLDDPREPLPAKPGDIQKIDYQYVRCGTCSIFMLTEPLSGWRHAEALPQRTMKEWAGIIKHLVDEDYPDADKIVLVEDNLNTHTLASLYSTYPPEEALRIAKKLEMHYTPKHGSWLDIAEIELSALAKQCLGVRRIPTIDELNKELSIWEHTRNSTQKGVDWHFSTSDARIKLKSLYPIINF